MICNFTPSRKTFDDLEQQKQLGFEVVKKAKLGEEQVNTHRSNCQIDRNETE